MVSMLQYHRFKGVKVAEVSVLSHHNQTDLIEIV
jgi:hypothetical protein